MTFEILFRTRGFFLAFPKKRKPANIASQSEQKVAEKISGDLSYDRFYWVSGRQRERRKIERVEATSNLKWTEKFIHQSLIMELGTSFELFVIVSTSCSAARPWRFSKVFGSKNKRWQESDSLTSEIKERWRVKSLPLVAKRESLILCSCSSPLSPWRKYPTHRKSLLLFSPASTQNLAGILRKLSPSGVSFIVNQTLLANCSCQDTVLWSQLWANFLHPRGVHLLLPTQLLTHLFSDPVFYLACDRTFKAPVLTWTGNINM